MSRATAHQKLITLVHAGWVEQIDSGAYRLALHATRMGLAALSQASLGERIMPFLQSLVDGIRRDRIDRRDRRRRMLHRAARGVRKEFSAPSCGSDRLLDMEQSASGRVLVGVCRSERH